MNLKLLDVAMNAKYHNRCVPVAYLSISRLVIALNFICQPRPTERKFFENHGHLFSVVSSFPFAFYFASPDVHQILAHIFRRPEEDPFGSRFPTIDLSTYLWKKERNAPRVRSTAADAANRLRARCGFEYSASMSVVDFKSWLVGRTSALLGPRRRV